MSRPKMTKEQAIEIFWSKVEKTDSCWNWTGASNPTGYGVFYGGRSCGLCDSYYTHRIAYNLIFDDYNSEMKVCHKCDNPSCCNPDHLFLGTHSDNMVDMHNKERWKTKTRTGENNSNSSLDWTKVREIRRLYHEEGLTQVAIGKMFNITNANVSLIVNNKAWIE
jgi:hypothetical protein